MAINLESETLPSHDSIIVCTVDTIKKSDNDTWNYRGLELSNGILCVLISHPNIDKAAAALDINIGSWADPNDVPGIAHFLEHMLFMGSVKYPNENEYSKLIESNGGDSNAFTNGQQTNYYFDIDPNLLSDALDVFAQFFISPLFLPSSIDREIQAVHSEFEGRQFEDFRRILQVEKSTSNPEHPYSKFTTGNIESLQTMPKLCGIDIRQTLLDFYENEYSANRMSLAVLGNQSLDELQSFVVKSFKDVPNKRLLTSKYPADPFGATRLKTICYIVPITEYRHMTITWMIPDHRELYYCNPESYVSFLINHEGIGSLLFHLKKLGLASELVSSGAYNAPGFNFFTIDLELTIEGLERWKDIVYTIYQYIAMMRKEGAKEWIFQEQKNMRIMNFQFSEKESPADFVSDLASQMRNYPLSECLFGPYEMREFRPDLISELLDEYLIPSKMRITLVSKDFVTIATEKEKWYGTQYKQEYLSEEFIKKCETCDINIDLHLPLPNDFIPTDFQLFHSQQTKPILCPQLPTKINENEFFRLYYAEDAFYKLPKAFIYFKLRNPLSDVDPIHYNMNLLYVALVNDSLSDFVYPAQLGGLTYELSISVYGIELSINGYNQKIRILLDTIIDRMINLKVDPKRFEILREEKKQLLKNFRRQSPSVMADYGIHYLIAEHQWNEDELLSCIEGITPQDIENFIPRMLAYFYVDSLMYGNLTKDQAIEYMMNFQQKFHQNHLFQPLYPGMWFNLRQIRLLEGCNFAYNMVNDAHHVRAIKIYLQCFQQTLENNALIELFSHIVNEPCFNQLRTKEQLGYIVNSNVCRARGAQGFEIIVQSTYELDYVDRRIELFLDSIRDYIEKISDDEFKRQRDGYIIKNIEIPKNMESQGNIFWSEIVCQQFCFDRPRLESEIIKTLKRTDLIRFYDHYISPHSLHRRKLALYVTPSSLALASPLIDELDDMKRNEKIPRAEEESTQIIQKSEFNKSPQLSTSHDACPLIGQLSLISIKDSEKIQANTLTFGEITIDEELNLSEIEWIDNTHIWKSKLSCYPLAQPYEKINVPIIYNL